MKTWFYNNPVFDDTGNIIDNKVIEISDHEILDDYWDWWSKAMIQKFGANHAYITPEHCIDDWVACNWAWEKKDE